MSVGALSMLSSSGHLPESPKDYTQGVPEVTHPTFPDICTSKSEMRQLHPEAAAVGRPEGSMPRRRSTEMVTPLTSRSKEP